MGWTAWRPGICAIAGSTFAVIGLSLGAPEAALLAAIVAGACFGFLHHNFYPARIFMGDSGALLLGFLLATLAVEGLVKTAALATLVLPLLVLAIPIIDTSFVVAKQMKYRQPLYEADRTHLHHRFLNIGFSQARAVAYMYLWCALLAGAALATRFLPPRPRGDWDVSNALIAGTLGLAAVAASLYIAYLLEIVKLANPRIRRREEQARSERGAAAPRYKLRQFSPNHAVLAVTKSGMLASDGAQFSPVARPGRSGCGTGRNHGGRHRRGRPGRLGGEAHGRSERSSERSSGSPPGSSPCTAATAESSRERRLGNAWTRPTSHLPKLAGGAVIILGLPVFLAAGLPVRGWLLAAVLWVAAELIGLLLSRLSLGADNLAASGVRGVGMMFRSVAVMVVVLVVAASDTELGLAAGILYALAYTLELALSLSSYFASEPTR